MFDPFLNSMTLTGLHLLALARAFARYRNPRRRAAGKHQAGFYRRAWQDAAAALGGSCLDLGEGIQEICIDGEVTRVIENTCAIDDPVTLALLADKVLTYRLLEAEGLPTPPHAIFSLKDPSPAVGFLGQSRSDGCDCVVKPAGGTGGGRGITTGIRTRWQLARAAAIAAVYGDELLIERQIEGDNYRLLYLDGELIDAFSRRLPAVVADGQSSIGRLVRLANEQRLHHRSGISQVLLTVDMDMQRTLAKQGYTLRSVPARGATVVLKTVVNENAGNDNTTATETLCPSIIEQGARAVRCLRARLAGVDLITRDPSVPLCDTGGVILEVNAPPNFYYHYHKRDGAFPVAEQILRRLLLERPQAAAGPFHSV